MTKRVTTGRVFSTVMAGLDPATHVLEPLRHEDVGPRLKAGDDAEGGGPAGMTECGGEGT